MEYAIVAVICVGVAFALWRESKQDPGPRPPAPPAPPAPPKQPEGEG